MTVVRETAAKYDDHTSGKILTDVANITYNRLAQKPVRVITT